MKFLALIAVTLLIASSQAYTDAEVYDVLDKINNSKYGQTLLATIALEMKAEGPVEDLIRMLQQTEADLRQAQSDDDAQIWVIQDECDADLANLEAEIDAAKKRIEQLTRELGEKIPIRDQKQVSRDRKAEFRNLVRQKIDELDANKALRDQEWAEEQRQHDEALAIIEKAKQIIVNAMTSFAQVKNAHAESFAQVSAHLKKHSKTQFNRKSWQTIITLMSEITSSAPVQADTSLVQKVIDLCDELIGKIAESREIERRDYQHWVNEYQNTRDKLSEKDAELTAEINQLDTEIDTLTKRINEATNERNDQETRKAQKEEEHADRLAWCDQENVNYANRRQARGDEMEVVSDAIALMQSNLRLFRQYVSSRLGGAF